MSVRGSKNKIILYTAGACSIIFIILLYQNTSQRLEAVEKSYDRCHLNEESLSAQLQVNLEYKVRLEKSLQQEKSEHAQIKQELQKKLEEEKVTRERDNLEAVNKFTALQQQYKFLKSQHEDVNQECGKLRQQHLTELEEKSQLESLFQRLKDELRLVKENKNAEIEQLKAKLAHFEKGVKESKAEFSEDHKKQDVSHTPIKLPDTLPLNASIVKTDAQPLSEPGIRIDVPESFKSSTSAKKVEQELFPSGNNAYVNTSTPMINPDAVNSQDKMLSGGVVPQTRQEPMLNVFDHKENVGAKPDEMVKDVHSDDVPQRGVLRPPDVFKDFAHVPAIQQYKEKLDSDKNNHAGEIGDEGESLGRNDIIQEGKPVWREGKVQNEAFIRQPVLNEIPKNPVYQYQGDYDARNEEGEDDDDVDPLEYNNEKNQQQQPPQMQQGDGQNVGIHFKMPFQEKHDSVMIQPK
ncbi:hypothetical protein RUM43_014467 [Polyplax serrata]|uniref:Golgi integral membrane protein 4 n=1 Tax=Polyplax serrata TaxID=468196 RepID=A0AAN8RYU7_POLSC